MKHRYFIFLIIFVLVPFLVLLNSTTLYSTIRNTSVSIFKPVFEKTYFIFYNFTDGIRRISSYPLLTQENEKLSNDNVQLRTALTNNIEIEAENKRLRSLLELKENEDTASNSALVIGRDMSLWSNWIMINRGSVNRIEKDTPLLSPQGLVGKVSSVGKKTARCILIIDRRSKVSGMIQRTRAAGIVEGTDEGLLKMRYLSMKSDVEIGDTVISSGLGGIFPKGLPIGTVITVGKDTNGLHLFATIRPFVNFNKLEEVICLES